MDYSDFLKIMKRWLEDSRFHRLLKFNQTRHWLDAQNMHEANFRDFLAWVLDPKQGHGLSDFFIKRLMLTEAATTGHTWDALKVETGYFGDMFVLTEGKTPDNKRIDLLLVDPTNKLLIIIERKDGAKVSVQQLDDYSRWAKKNYPDYDRCLLVSDSQEKDHQNMKDEWYQLNDDWLVSALKDVTDNDQLPEIINSQFKDWQVILDGRGLWEKDEYYKGVEDEIKAFAASESKDLLMLSSTELKINNKTYKFTDIDESIGIREVLPKIEKPDQFPPAKKKQVLSAVSLAMKYHILLNALITTNQLACVENEINENAEYADKFLFEPTQGRKYHALSITLKIFDELDKWPVFIAIEKPLDEDGSKPLRARLRLKVHPQLDKLVSNEAWGKFLEEFRGGHQKEFPKKIYAKQEWMNSPWKELSSLSTDSLSNNLRKLLEIKKMLFSVK